MIVLSDMDGVAFDFISTVLYRYNNDWNDSLTVADVTDYNMHTIVKPECGLKVYDYFHEKGIFDCPLLPGAKEVIDTIVNLGHDFYFVTKPVDYSVFCMLEKQQSVDRHFPQIGYKKVIFTCQKHMVRGDFLIDDLTSNLEEFEGHRILVDAPWNRSADTSSIDKRVFSWGDILEYVQQNS